MTFGSGLTAVGLFFSTIAALMMAEYPVQAPKFTDDGKRIFVWTQDDNRGYKKYQRFSKFAVYLLALGFLMQLFGVLLS